MTEMISVIGGSGFVGTRLCHLLSARGIRFRIVDIAESRDFPGEVVHADVRDRISLEEALLGSTAIVNLAAEHRDDVRPLSRYTEVNVDGSRNVCEVAESLRISRIVF